MRARRAPHHPKQVIRPVSSSDLESAHFSGQLVERVGWAVRDANELERRLVEPSPSRALALSPPRAPRLS
jgi:hypothetical protein